MKTIKDHLNKTSEMSKSITLHSAKLQKTADNIKYQVRKRVDEINQELKYREEIIIQDVEGNYEQATKSLKIEAEKVNLQQEILQNIQHSNVQLYLHGSQFELVTKGKSIEQTVQDNNPDDVELNLPELDTTEAELKLHDMKKYEDLQEDFKDMCFTFERHKTDCEKYKINQQMTVDELETQLQEETEAKEKTVGDLKTQMNLQKEKIIKDLEEQLRRQMESNTMVVGDLLVQQLQEQKVANDKITKDLEKRLQREIESNNMIAGDLLVQQLQEQKEANDKTVDDLEAQLRLEKEAKENSFQFTKNLEEQLRRQMESNTMLVDDLVQQLQQQKEANDKLLPQPVGGTWEQVADSSGHPIITCRFPAGIQNASHRHPGQPYPASTLTCGITNSAEGPGQLAGSEMAALMKRAFTQRLLFTITDGQVAWHGAKLNAFYSSWIHKKGTINILSTLGIH